jgi:putative tricarboxylic transport membrane protein
MNGRQPGDERLRVSARSVEIIVALAVIAFAAVLIVDARRLGAGWASDGPEPGFYPFYVGLIMGAAALAVLVQQWRAGARAGIPFVDPGKFRPLLAMLLPSIVYVGAIFVLGIYVASALFLFAFMKWQGSIATVKALLLAVAIPLATFMLFELWFKVPLAKGPLEAVLGF